MSTENVVELVGIILAFIGTNVGHYVSARNSNNKMMEAFREEIRTIREESKEADQKTHEEISLIRKDISTLSDRVEKHNNVIERTYKLESDVALTKQKLDSLERGAK